MYELAILFSMPIIGFTVTAFLIVLAICFIKQVVGLIQYGEFIPLGYGLSSLLRTTFVIMICGIVIMFLIIGPIIMDMLRSPYFFG